MLRHIIFASVPLAFAAFAGTAGAQSALSSCDPVTGLSANGAPCVELTPIDPANINTPGAAEGSEQYARLDTSTLGQTYECRTADGGEQQFGRGGALLIEDCGEPLAIGETKPFWGTTGTPTAVPTPIPAAPIVPAAPVIVAAPAAPVVAAAPAFAPVTGIAAAGLGGAIPFAVVGAAALAGIVAVAASDDDDSTNSTTGTNPMP
jgi:hypothetical protein